MTYRAAMATGPDAFAGCAEHYLLGRPPYSTRLGPDLAADLGLDRTGVLLDVGSGPGVVAAHLAPFVGAAVALDLDAAMAAVAAEHVPGGRAVQAAAGALPVRPGSLRLVTFAQSFHRVDQPAVLDATWDALAPGGAVALVAHEFDAAREPTPTGDPELPNDAVRVLVERHLGPPEPDPPARRFAEALAASRFGGSARTLARNPEGHVMDVDMAVHHYFSMSWCAPGHFGAGLAAFEAELRSLLAEVSPASRFWEWPGDTVAVWAAKPA